MRERTHLPLTEDSTDTAPSNMHGKYVPGQVNDFICDLFHKTGIMPSSKFFVFIETERHIVPSVYLTDHDILQMIFSRSLCTYLICRNREYIYLLQRT